MSTPKFLRLGGISGFVAVAATLSLFATTDPSGNRTFVTHVLSWVIGLASIVFVYALYLRWRVPAPAISLLAVVAAIGETRYSRSGRCRLRGTALAMQAKVSS